MCRLVAGSKGVSSSTICLVVAAYTHTVEARITRPASARRAASSTLAVPTVFRATLSTGEAKMSFTSAMAARWNTAPEPLTASTRAGRSMTSTGYHSASVWIGGRLSSTRTRWPAPKSASTTCEPMKTDPPVMETLIGTFELLSRSWPWLRGCFGCRCSRPTQCGVERRHDEIDVLVGHHGRHREADVALAQPLGAGQRAGGGTFEHRLAVQRRVVHLAGQADPEVLPQRLLQPGAIDPVRQVGDVLVVVAARAF